MPSHRGGERPLYALKAVTSPNELTLFRSLGLAIEDMAAAERAVANARSRGAGVEVEL